MRIAGYWREYIATLIWNRFICLIKTKLKKITKNFFWPQTCRLSIWQASRHKPHINQISSPDIHATAVISVIQTVKTNQMHMHTQEVKFCLSFNTSDPVLWLTAHTNTQPNKHRREKGNVHLLSWPSWPKHSAAMPDFSLVLKSSMSAWEREKK